MAPERACLLVVGLARTNRGLTRTKVARASLESGCVSSCAGTVTDSGASLIARKPASIVQIHGSANGCSPGCDHQFERSARNHAALAELDAGQTSYAEPMPHR